jgi:hypothetical protein
MVLDIAGPDRRQSYGMTLLQIVQHQTRPVLNPGLLGSADPSTRLQRRLVMIRDYQARSRRSAWLAIGAIVMVSLLGLTRPPTAQTEEPVDQSKSSVETANESTTNRNKSADVQATAKRFEIKGRCLDDDGKPVDDAEVWLFYFDRYGAPPAQKWQQRTGRSGEFRFERREPLADERDKNTTWWLRASQNTRVA